MAVLFYAETDPYYEISNFYQPKIPFTINHLKVTNTEAYYQSCKWFSPNNDRDVALTYQSLILGCNTANKAFILGKAQFVHGLKNKWSLNIPSLHEGKMTLNEAIALYTSTPINDDWDNAKTLHAYRKKATTLLTYDHDWWEEHKVGVMTDIVWEKFNSPTHHELQSLLLSTTGDIREHTNRDLFWASGGSKGGGINMLGQILMLTRAKLNNLDFNIDLNHVTPPEQSKGSYVKLSNTLYYGIHPSIVLPDIKVNHYISLVEKHEFPDYQVKTSFPIKDRKAPTLDGLTKIVNHILSLKGVVYVFCLGGTGRSGTVAAAVYGKIHKLSGKEALKHINKEWHTQRDLSLIRPQIVKLGSPQTAVQKKVVKQYLD